MPRAARPPGRRAGDAPWCGRGPSLGKIAQAPAGRGVSREGAQQWTARRRLCVRRWRRRLAARSNFILFNIRKFTPAPRERPAVPRKRMDGGPPRPTSTGHEKSRIRDPVAHRRRQTSCILGPAGRASPRRSRAARAGLRTTLVDAGQMPGASDQRHGGRRRVNARDGRADSARGREVFAECQRLGGYVRPLKTPADLVRLLDPEVMKLAVAGLLARPASSCCCTRWRPTSTSRTAGSAPALPTRRARASCAHRSSSTARAMPNRRAAGGTVLKGGPGGELQPVSLMFRMSGVESRAAARVHARAPRA